MSLFSTLMNNTRDSTHCLVSLCDSVPNAPSIENFPFLCMIVSTYATLLGNWIIAPFSVNDCEFGMLGVLILLGLSLNLPLVTTPTRNPLCP